MRVAVNTRTESCVAVSGMFFRRYRIGLLTQFFANTRISFPKA